MKIIKKECTREVPKIALCTLGSTNWGAFKNPQDMKKACRVLVRSLSNLLSYQEFLSIQSKLSNQEFEPLGIGITNLAYWHAKRGFKYGEPQALAEVKRFMEHQTFYITQMSVELAKERGACTKSADTWYGKGKFVWERRNKNVDELTDFTPTLDWETLRKDMLKYGIRNALLSALPPVESSSVVLNSTNGIELPMALITVKESKAGSFVQVVPEYKRLKNRYQLLWDQTDCIEYLKTAAVLAAFVDQSISVNTFYSPKHFKDGKVPATLIIKNLMLGTRWGLKNFYYSLLDKAGAKRNLEETQNTQPVTVIEPDSDEPCESCVL
jgi:ribonucleoside-diphosphate reductase alpha chain